MSKPTNDQIRAAVHRSYGRPCSQVYCAARGDNRQVYIPSEPTILRDEASEGTWVTVDVWIPDEDIKEG